MRSNSSKKYGKCFLALLVLLLIAFFIANAYGAYHIPFLDIFNFILGRSNPSNQTAYQVFWDIRVPRVLFAIVAGSALALTGVVTQALFRNPLAEPSLIGISAGASLGAVIAIVLLGNSFIILAGSAFVGSFLTGLMAYTLGKRYPSMAGLLLAGIAINAIAGSFTGLLVYSANDMQLRDFTFWSMGSLAKVDDSSTLVWIVPWCTLLFIYFLKQWPILNALLLGQNEAAHLGFNIEKKRKHLLLAVALLVGPIVSLSGGIAFVGLVVPHIMRMLIGANHRYLMPLCVLTGAIALLLADLLARTLVIPAEIPIGLLTSLIGGPFFFYLLAKGQRLS